MSDGLAQGATEFFDVDNCPSWDYWVGFRGETTSLANKTKPVHLLAFVPEVLVPLVDIAVKCNAERCIVWERDVTVP